MTTVPDFQRIACNWRCLSPAPNRRAIPSTLGPASIRHSKNSICCPFRSKLARNGVGCQCRKFRCSIAEDSKIAQSKVGADNFGNGESALDCVIVGAGISGLSIAQALATKHADVAPNFIVTEARDRGGGNIITVERDGYLWEEGPNSFQPSDPMLTMVVDSGLKDDLVLGDPNAPRFVLWDSKLRPVPSKPSDLPFFDLMSFGGKLRAGFGALGFRPPPPGHEESVEEFVHRNLGDEVFERLIEPFCSGVYAGNPSKLSMKAAFGKVWNLEQNGGSIIGGTFKAIQKRSSSPKLPRDARLPKPKGQTVGSFRKGLTMLPDAISARLGSKIKFSWKLSSIVKLENGRYGLTYETAEGLVCLQSRSVVMTVPSYVASSLLQPLSATAADALSKFYYPPVAAVSISYPKEAIRSECLIDGELKGFGQLHPRSQGVETLGTIYSSSLFPNRAPPGRILLLNYIGGATNPGIISKTQSQLVEAVDRDLRKMLIDAKAKDPLILGVRVWPQAIPQFLVGHFDILDAARSALRNSGSKGLFLGGNYVTGVALGRCVEGAYEVASEVTDFLSQYVYK
ncbi:protoporphyrinogen oxidase 1, chloroplastic [Diospyros lotus]|uniref:protoporphyrinogen oxidase 1, chloroplastic n=1 Tax=Diospyros lotus TaxID=55363 RepID=UPI00224E31CA|nr:protoporphyrinogen oxidase 1, chloroplastic [Diospyros lotus]